MANAQSLTHRTMITLAYWSRTACIVLVICAAMFVAANILAYYTEEEIFWRQPDDFWSKLEWPSTDVGKRLLADAVNASSWEEAIKPFEMAPNFEQHPILHYITMPTSNEFYRIGVEGIRYEAEWSDKTVRTLLDSEHSSTYMLGGSTMLGYGLANDQTLPYFLNGLFENEDSVALNFGSQAYDQHRELEKLIYLLRSGYRPRNVVFVDGWNDILDMGRSNMRLQDKIIFHGFLKNRGDIAFTPGTPGKRVGSLRLFIESLPIYRIYRNSFLKKLSAGTIDPERDSFLQGFDFREANWVHNQWAEFAEKNKDLLARQIISYFRNNLDMIKALADGYGFDAYVFYQPIGLLDPDNAFVPPAAREAPGYGYIENMDKVVREAISSGKLNMIDLSQILHDSGDINYVDVAHYSPRANNLLAKEIFRHIGD